MIRVATLSLALSLLAVPAMAKDAPKGVVTIKAPANGKQGDVKMKHQAHAEQKCAVCHGEGEPGKMAPMDQKKAHALCQDCHKKDAAKKAPVKCDGCHEKKKPAAS